MLSYEEFLRVQEALEGYEDLQTLRDEKAAAAEEPTRALDGYLRKSKTERPNGTLHLTGKLPTLRPSSPFAIGHEHFFSTGAGR